MKQGCLSWYFLMANASYISAACGRQGQGSFPSFCGSNSWQVVGYAPGFGSLWLRKPPYPWNHCVHSFVSNVLIPQNVNWWDITVDPLDPLGHGWSQCFPESNLFSILAMVEFSLASSSLPGRACWSWPPFSGVGLLSQPLDQFVNIGAW